jgi:cellulose biosynthesis protein BcsQ
MKAIAFFNNKGGVGKTTLAYHLAWMYSDMGTRVLAADLDPQANLTSMFLDQDQLAELWPEDARPKSILGAVEPIMKGTGDVGNAHVEKVADNLHLIVGDLGLSRFEARLSDAWPRCLGGDESAFRTISSFYRILREAADRTFADVVLIDVGPNLGAINLSALISASFVVVPLAPDLFSLQGLRNLGPTLRDWRKEWTQRLDRKPSASDPPLELPPSEMRPVGYVVMQHAVRADRPVRAYEKWIQRIPQTYADKVLGGKPSRVRLIENDPNMLASLKHYRSLMPMAQDARKPIFHLKAVDGALGGHASGVEDCRKSFKELADRIAAKTFRQTSSVSGVA